VIVGSRFADALFPQIRAAPLILGNLAEVAGHPGGAQFFFELFHA
jgi:hypothetical protein